MPQFGSEARIIIVPFFTPQLSSYWVHLVTPISARLAQPLIRGLYKKSSCMILRPLPDFPQIVPSGFDDAVKKALERGTGAETAWFDAFDLHALPTDFAGVKEGMLIDMRVRNAAASADRVAAVFSSLGGRRGWLSADALWRFRGWLDRMAGGVGLHRGRRSPIELRAGDALDFWRVEAYQPGRLLRLRAEMKLPGRAWLQFEAEPRGSAAATLRQTAFFEPRGLVGFLYWYGVALFHQWVFGRMATCIAREAEKTARDAAGPAPPTGFVSTLQPKSETLARSAIGCCIPLAWSFGLSLGTVLNMMQRLRT